MRKPDYLFTIRVVPVARMIYCETAKAEERRGLYGFHPHSCPNCRVESMGWEFWGENGHLQGSAPTRERLIHFLKIKARQQWQAADYGERPTIGGSKIHGYRFKLARGTQYYKG